jgi:hypothetical protein
MNLKEKMMNLTQIEDWYLSKTGNDSNLYLAFNSFLNTNNVFANIYVAIRDNPQYAEQEEHFSYYNVGFTVDDITKYFALKYGLNYFAYNFTDSEQVDYLKEKMAIIYKANLYTYRKLIESMGYTYNPLFNVDGIELYSNAEALGNSKSEQQPTGIIKTQSGSGTNGNMDTESTHYINPYDQNDGTATYINDRTKNSALTSVQSFENYKYTTTVSHSSADNYKYVNGQWVKDGTFGIEAKDVAFGINFGGPERFYAEKRIRQGNIGVTKSTELLRDQRDLVKFNILDVFMKDLEKDLVVGIF